jgi:hypothetical protein
MIKMYIGLHVKHPSLLSDFNETGIYRQIFEKHSSTRITFQKIHPVEVELLHTDGRTDGRANMTKLIFALRNFAKVPKNKPHLKTRPSKQEFMKQTFSSVQAVFFLQYTL